MFEDERAELMRYVSLYFLVKQTIVDIGRINTLVSDVKFKKMPAYLRERITVADKIK